MTVPSSWNSVLRDALIRFETCVTTTASQLGTASSDSTTHLTAADAWTSFFNEHAILPRWIDGVVSPLLRRAGADYRLSPKAAARIAGLLDRLTTFVREFAASPDILPAVTAALRNTPEGVFAGVPLLRRDLRLLRVVQRERRVFLEATLDVGSDRRKIELEDIGLISDSEGESLYSARRTACDNARRFTSDVDIDTLANVTDLICPDAWEHVERFRKLDTMDLSEDEWDDYWDRLGDQADNDDTP